MLVHSLRRVRAWQGTTMTDWEAAAASTNPPSPCRWDINQALLLCKDFRMFWSMSTLGKWEVCPFVKLALRDIFTNYIQGLFRRKLELYVICTKVPDSIKNDQWLTEFPFLCFTVSLYLVQKYYAKLYCSSLIHLLTGYCGVEESYPGCSEAALFVLYKPEVILINRSRMLGLWSQTVILDFNSMRGLFSACQGRVGKNRKGHCFTVISTVNWEKSKTMRLL